MYLTTCPDPVRLSAAVAHHCRTSARHLCAVTLPGGTYVLYGSPDSTHAAKIEALSDHPLAQHVQEFEYLPPMTVQSLARGSQDPIQSTLQALGQVGTLPVSLPG
jgi:hypothetical protein